MVILEIMSPHIYDHSTGSITNLGLDDFSFNLIIDGNLVVFEVHEGRQGNTDLNGDGDIDGGVLHVYDHSTGVTTNLGLVGSIKFVEGNLVIIPSERDQGIDLNNDGDTEDNVFHIYDHTTGSITNLGLAVGSQLIIDDNLVSFLVNEHSQGNTDLNGDGDTDDDILHVIEFTPSEISCIDSTIPELISSGSYNVIQGTDSNDILQGTSDDDLIFGNGGDDLILGDEGNDCIFGDDGNDLIYGSIGDDYISGGNGDDSIFGRGGHDTIFGDSGNDTLFGAKGDDILNGGLGNDHLMDDYGNDTLDGGDDTDMCYDKYGNNSFENCEIKSEE